MTKEICRVADLGLSFQTLITAYNIIDANHFGAVDDEKRRMKEQLDALDERRQDMERHATFLVAESAMGALYQIVLASGFTDLIVCDSPAGSKNRELLDQIQRLLYSARAFIETSSGASAEQVGADYYMPTRYDPHMKAAVAFSVKAA